MQLLRTALTGTAIATAGSVALGAAAARRLLHPAPFTPAESELVWTREQDVPGTEPDGVARVHVVHVHGQSIGPSRSSAACGCGVPSAPRTRWSTRPTCRCAPSTRSPSTASPPPRTPPVPAAPSGSCCRAGPPAPSPRRPRRRGRPSTGSSGWHRCSTSGPLRGAVTAARFPAAVGVVAGRIATTPGLSRLAGVPYPLTVTRWQDEGTPTLLLHSAADPLVAADDVAAQRARGATTVAFDEARHTLEWNEDPERWETAVRDFAAALG